MKKKGVDGSVHEELSKLDTAKLFQQADFIKTYEKSQSNLLKDQQGAFIGDWTESRLFKSVIRNRYEFNCEKNDKFFSEAEIIKLHSLNGTQ